MTLLGVSIVQTLPPPWHLRSVFLWLRQENLHWHVELTSSSFFHREILWILTFYRKTVWRRSNVKVSGSISCIKLYRLTCDWWAMQRSHGPRWGLILNLARAQWLIGLSYRSHLKGLPCSSLLTWKETSLFEIGDQIDSAESVSFVCLHYPHLPASETLGGEKKTMPAFIFYHQWNSVLSPLLLSESRLLFP